MTNKDKALDLINQMIDRSVLNDSLEKIEGAKNFSGPLVQGDSWMTFHLKSLKELIETF